MRPSAERPFCLEDYLPFLKSLADGEEESVLIGGLAVSDWAELFLDENNRHLFDLPIFNNDIKHLAILARVIPRFLGKLSATPVAEYDAKEDVEVKMGPTERAGARMPRPFRWIR